MEGRGKLAMLLQLQLLTVNHQVFDAVVVATGHYHAPYVPDLLGLSDWRNKWPENVIHSKQYRVPEQFKDKVSLILTVAMITLFTWLSHIVCPSDRKWYISNRHSSRCQ